jgi:hypothetical protein
MIRRPLILLTLACIGLAGCVSLRQKTIVGVPLDPELVSRIKPGSTGVEEVLRSLGPPDYVVEGTQRMPNADALGTAHSVNPVGPLDLWTTPIKPRILTPPERTVILIYSFVNFTTSFDMVVGVGEGAREVNKDEIFVFVSRDSLTVTEVVSGKPLPYEVRP